MKILNAIDKVLVLITQIFCAILLCAIVLLCFSNTVARYVFNSPFMKAEEIMRYMSIWLVLVGSSLTCRVDGHTTLDLLTLIIKNRKVKAVLFVLTRSLCVIVMALLIVPSFEMIRKLGVVISPSTRVPMSVLYYSFPVGAVLIIIGYLRAIPQYTRKILNGEDKKEEKEAVE